MKESNVHFLCPDCHIHGAGACARRGKHDHQPSKCLLGTAPPHATATDANDRTASARARAYRHPAAEGRQGAFYPALSQWRARSSGSRDFACEIGPLRMTIIARLRPFAMLAAAAVMTAALLWTPHAAAQSINVDLGQDSLSGRAIQLKIGRASCRERVCQSG